jgi:hypothetical protein
MIEGNNKDHNNNNTDHSDRLTESDRKWDREYGQKFYPTMLFNSETGEHLPFLLSYCMTCKYPEPSVFNVAEFSPKHDGRLICKVTGKSNIDGGH